MHSILYIEDDDNLARLLARRMERHGFSVAISQSGEDGLARLRHERFDMVLVDYHLPGISGLEALTEITKLPDAPPMILLTASGDERVAINALQNGAADYAIKDVNLSYIDLLPAIMQAAYTKARLQRENDQQRQDLIDARDRAESANQAKTDFLAMMSHEIRTPMNVVIGLSDLISRTQLDAKQREMIKTLQSSASLLLTLINDLLNLTRIESGQFELELVRFNFADFGHELQTMFAAEAERKGLRLQLENRTGTQDYMSDKHRLQQVLVNLIGNALKFTESGSVTLRIEANAGAPDKAGGSRILISVIDTGIGIAADKLDNVFEKFVQADQTITRRFGGSGLGLSISKGIVETMGGTLIVTSTVGEGSVFTLNMPMQVADPVSGAVSGPTEDGDKSAVAVPIPASQTMEPDADGKPRILLVEDYPANIMVATLLLEGMGYAVDSATSGLAALERVRQRQQPYATILMDVQMPDIDGYETTRRLRLLERERGWKQRVIGVTAHALAGDREKCIDSGMDDYMSKPINPELLQIKLR